jgi:hypothetical protein
MAGMVGCGSPLAPDEQRIRTLRETHRAFSMFKELLDYYRGA